MYLLPRQHAFGNPQFDISPQIDFPELPNVTKGITDALQLCETAGFDRNGVQCGLSIAFILFLVCALLLAIVVFVIPALAALLLGIVTALAALIATIVTAVVASMLGFVAVVTVVVTSISRMVMAIVSAPFRLCLGSQDPVAPSENARAGGVGDEQIRYVRETIESPPSYESTVQPGK